MTRIVSSELGAIRLCRSYVVACVTLDWAYTRHHAFLVSEVPSFQQGNGLRDTLVSPSGGLGWIPSFHQAAGRGWHPRFTRRAVGGGYPRFTKQPDGGRIPSFHQAAGRGTGTLVSPEAVQSVGRTPRFAELTILDFGLSGVGGVWKRATVTPGVTSPLSKCRVRV